MIDKPLYGNPLAGGSGQLGGATFRQEGDMGRYVAFNDPGQPGAGFSSLEEYLAAGNKLPEQKTLKDLIGVSNANFNVSPPGTLKLDPQATSNMLGGMFNVTPPSTPVSEQTPLPGLPDLPPMFRTPGLPPQQEETPGARDLIETIGTVKGPEDTLFGVANNPYNRVGQQLTGPNQFDDQFSSMGDRLTKLEEGIASLLNQNRGFGFNSMQPRYGAPNYGYSPFSMTGLGSLFGGYYG